MTLTTLGDRAQQFLTMRQNTRIRDALTTRATELSTGRVADVTAHLNGDTTALRDLDLSNTCLCDEGMSALAPQFASGRGLCRLTDLDLGHNEFRDAGLWDLVKHMGGMTGLRHLNLYNNQFVSKDTWTKFSNHLLDVGMQCAEMNAI